MSWTKTRRPLLALFTLLAFFLAAPSGRTQGGVWRGELKELDKLLALRARNFEALEKGQGPLRSGHRSRNREPVEARWTFLFEHSREAILADRIAARRAAAPLEGNAWRTSVLPALLEAVKNRDARIRAAAAVALGKRGGDGVVAPLTALLENADAEVVKSAMLGLGLSGADAARSPLLEGLASEETGRASYAALGLGLLGREDATHELARALPRAVESGRFELASAIVVSLGAVGRGNDEAKAALLAEIPWSRTALPLLGCRLQALARLGGDDACEVLLKTTRDASFDLRTAAFLGLGRFPEAAPVQRLLETARGSGDLLPRVFALASLGCIATETRDAELREEVVGTLVETAGNLIDDCRGAAFANLALGVAGERRGLDRLRSLIEPDVRTRYRLPLHESAVVALGLLRDSSSRSSLEEIVEEPDCEPTYRGYAVLALGLLGAPLGLPTIRKAVESHRGNPHVQRNGLWALALLGDERSFPTMVDRLKTAADENDPVALAAARALGILSSECAVGPLLRCVAGADVTKSTRILAIHALGCMFDRAPVPRFALFLQGSHYLLQPEWMKDLYSRP